jgi:ABC-type nitrate/sulfonate/bicarbonate transport system permease component
MRKVKKFLPPIVLITTLVLLWQIAVSVFGLPEFFIPSPLSIAAAFGQDFFSLMVDAQVTLAETFIGISFAIFFGSVFAVLLDLSNLFKNAVYPLLVISQTVPVIVLAPLFVIYFGFGIAPKVLTVALICFFPIAINFFDGLRSVSPELIEIGYGLGIRKFNIYRQIKIPLSAPSFFSGLKIAATYSVTGAVIGEWMASSSGLGHYMLVAKNAYEMPALYSGIFLVALLSILLTAIVKLIERKFYYV